MFRIAVCDDSSRQTEILLAFLDTYRSDKPDIEIHYESYASGRELISALDAGGVFDLFLLDILMPELNGIELAREIRKRNADVPLIFLTASADYALDAFDVSAIQYILKPCDTDKLFSVLDKIVSSVKPEHEQYLMLSTSGRIVKVPFASIICVELFGRAMRVYQTNGIVLLSKTIRTPFDEAVAPVLSDTRFLSPHKSYVINMAWVEELTGKSFVMKHGLNVPIPRYKYAEAKARYFAWLSERGIGKMGASRND